MHVELHGVRMCALCALRDTSTSKFLEQRHLRRSTACKPTGGTIDLSLSDGSEGRAERQHGLFRDRGSPRDAEPTPVRDERIERNTEHGTHSSVDRNMSLALASSEWLGRKRPILGRTMLAAPGSNRPSGATNLRKPRPMDFCAANLRSRILGAIWAIAEGGQL